MTLVVRLNTVLTVPSPYAHVTHVWARLTYTLLWMILVFLLVILQNLPGDLLVRGLPVEVVVHSVTVWDSYHVLDLPRPVLDLLVVNVYLVLGLIDSHLLLLKLILYGLLHLLHQILMMLLHLYLFKRQSLRLVQVIIQFAIVPFIFRPILYLRQHRALVRTLRFPLVIAFTPALIVVYPVRLHNFDLFNDMLLPPFIRNHLVVRNDCRNLVSLLILINLEPMQFRHIQGLVSSNDRVWVYFLAHHRQTFQFVTDVFDFPRVHHFVRDVGLVGGRRNVGRSSRERQLL